MSRGGYNGGSSLIGRGGFSSYDPAEDRSEPSNGRPSGRVSIGPPAAPRKPAARKPKHRTEADRKHIEARQAQRKARVAQQRKAAANEKRRARKEAELNALIDRVGTKPKPTNGKPGPRHRPRTFNDWAVVKR